MLTSTLPRWLGDAEPEFVLGLAQVMNASAAVELIAPHAPGAARKALLHGLPVTRFRYWWPKWQAVAYQGGITWRLHENPWRLAQLPSFFFALIWTIVRRLRQAPAIDLIHAHWLIPQGLAALIARRIANRPVPILCTSHGGDLFGLRGRPLNTLKRLVLRKCEGISVVSGAMAETASALAPGIQPRVIPMGTDLRARFIPAVAPASDRSHRLIFVGRLVPKKGLSHLLDALAILRARGTTPSLEVVGHGPLLEPLRKQAQALGLAGQVQFVGPIPQKDLPRHYQAAAIAVFPFVQADDGDQEGFGLVMVEAMGCGCAVIASELPAVRDVIKTEETGILVPTADPRALAVAIQDAFENSQRIGDIAERGRRYALECFDWDVTRRKFEALYCVLLTATLPHVPSTT